MSLFSKIFWNSKTKEHYEYNDLDILYSRIEDNYAQSEKIFKKLDSLKQRDLLSILNSSNRQVYISDFKNYVKLYEEEIIDYKVLNDFLARYKTQQYIGVDSFVNEVYDYLNNYGTTNLSSEEYINLLQALQRIEIEKSCIEDYSFSFTIVRYLRTEREFKPKSDFKLFRTTPIWHTTHMYLDLLDSLKKELEGFKNGKNSLHSFLNTIKYEPKIFLRTFTLLN